MKRQKSDLSGQRGFVLVYMAATLTVLLLFAGLAVDSGRAYVVKAQLTKAVDGAALAAARSLNSGAARWAPRTPTGARRSRSEATRIFNANFPVGYLGASALTDPASAGFYAL